MVTMSTVPSGSRDYNDRVTALANSFTKAVVDGDCIQCRTIATELGKMRPQLEVTQLQSGETLSIQVILQRQGVERATITLQITSNMTVKHLKAMMDRDYKLPMKLQCWIYGRQLLGDDVTIEEMGVKDGAVFGLYVMSEKFASLPPPPPQVEIPVSVQQPVLQTVEEVANPEPVSEVPLQTEPAAPVPVREITWACSACTYANQPTRPSCEMCGSDRPDDFILPDDYQPSAEERRRLEQEEMMTTLFRQEYGAKEGVGLPQFAGSQVVPAEDPDEEAVEELNTENEENPAPEPGAPSEEEEENLAHCLKVLRKLQRQHEARTAAANNSGQSTSES